MRRWKRRAKLFYLTVSALLLTSCAMIPGYSEPSDQTIISAIGFDAEGEGIRISAKTVATEVREASVLSGRGATIEEAVSSMLALSMGTPDVSHCALAILGEGIDDGWLWRILDYFDRSDTLTASAYFVSANNAFSLLSAEGVSGYRLATAIGQCAENPGMDAECRYYSLLSARLEEDGIIAIPHFYAGGEVELYGMRIYRSGRPILTLTRAESGYYMMIRGLFRGGVISDDRAGLSGGIGIADCDTEYLFDQGILRVVCRITPDRDLLGEEHLKELCDRTREALSRLYSELSVSYGDVFAISRVAALEEASLNEAYEVVFECVVKEGER